MIGYFYTAAVYLSRPDSIGNAWIGISIGALLSGGSSAFELFFINRPESKIRALPFYASFFIRIVVHLSIIIASILLVQFIFSKIIGTRIFLIGDEIGDVLTDIGFSVVILAAIIFWMQMRVFIGSRTLKNLIIGNYYKPQTEERIFMIVDVLGSTAAAQKIGDDKFHEFLNRLFVLFDDVIHAHGGEVHSYVGDAIFIVWPFSDEKELNTKALVAISELNKVCEVKHDTILEEFGVSPKIRAAMHGGSIVVGEMGRRKRQITYLGNTLNLTSRLEGLAKQLNIPYLISDDVLMRMSLPEGITTKPLGEKAVKGSAKKSLQFLKL